MYLLRGISPRALSIVSLRSLERQMPIITFLSLIKVYNSDNEFTKIALLKYMKLFTREFYYKAELDYVIVGMLDSRYPSSMRYNQIEKEISSCLPRKVPSATLSLHLGDLRFRHVLDKRKEQNRHTFYSLTKEFKDKLDIQKTEHPESYEKNALSLDHFRRQWSFSLDNIMTTLEEYEY